MAPAFSTSCIPSSINPTRIGDLEIVCQLVPAPDPCFEFPFEIPLPPPHIYGFGCVCPTSTFIGTGGAVVTGHLQPNAEDCCDLDLLVEVDTSGVLDLVLDLPCPNIGTRNIVPSQSPPVQFLDGTSSIFGGIIISSNRGISQLCEYNIEVMLGVPCSVLTTPNPASSQSPNIKVGGSSLKAGLVISSSTVVATGCEFSFDLAIDIPCPILSSSSSTSTGGLILNAAPSAGVTIVSSSTADTCNFNIDLDVSIPCPVLNTRGPGASGSSSSLSQGIHILPAVRQIDGWMTISSSNTSVGCNYDLDFAIGVPCPNIVGSSGIIVTSSSSTSGNCGIYSITFDTGILPIFVGLTVEFTVLNSIVVSGDQLVINQTDISFTDGLITTSSLTTGSSSLTSLTVLVSSGVDGNGCLIVGTQDIFFLGTIGSS